MRNLKEEKEYLSLSNRERDLYDFQEKHMSSWSHKQIMTWIGCHEWIENHLMEGPDIV